MNVKRTLVLCLLFAACRPENPIDVKTDAGSPLNLAASADSLSTVTTAETVHRFMSLSYDRVAALGVSPPLASRVYAYVALSTYEGARAASGSPFTFADRLVGLEDLPQPGRARFDRRLAAASAAYVALTSLLPDSDTEISAWKLLLSEYNDSVEAGASSATLNRSFDLGYSVGEAIVDYAGSDGFAATRGRDFVIPVGEDKWVPTGPVLSPLEPYWGTLRGFALFDRRACVCPPPTAYSAEPTSSFYAEARATYDAVVNGAAEHQEIARFWADAPKDTGTPPGHWLKIVELVSREQRLGLLGTSLVYAAVHLAVADAFILGWNEKYLYNLLRPETYIQRHIDPSWKPLLSTPPFPEYISGHSVGSGAAAEVLSAFFGESYAFSDDTAQARGFAARSFQSFSDAAAEAAVSRLYGGIHYPMGNREGLALGECVGGLMINTLLQ